MTTKPILPGLEKGSTNEELTNMAMVTSMFMPKSAQNLGAMRSLLMLFLSYITTPLECFLRVEHGERTLSILRVFNSLVALQILWIVSSGLSALTQQIVNSSIYAGMVQGESSSIAVSPFFQEAFLVVSAYHLWRISYRRRKGILWHSMSSGISILDAVGLIDLVNHYLGRINLLGRWRVPYRITRWTVYLYIEPILGILAADIIHRFDTTTGAWLLVASLSLFVRNQMMHAQQRHILLNYWDSLLDSQMLSDAADQKPPKDTAGVMVIPGFAEAIAHAETLDIAGRVSKTFTSDEYGRPGKVSTVNYE